MQEFVEKLSLTDSSVAWLPLHGMLIALSYTGCMVLQGDALASLR